MAIIAIADGNYYVPVLASATSWTAAQAAAQASGGSLVRLSSDGENSFVRDLVEQNFTGDYWIGANDAAIEGRYVDSFGLPLIYTKWAAGEPDGPADADYVTGNVDGSGGWGEAADLNPDSVAGFVVEFSGRFRFRQKSNEFGTSADTFIGSGTEDRIAAAGGNDTISGGEGSDRLSGGFGDDVFVIENGGRQRDVIVDFDVRGNDTFLLLGFDLDFAEIMANTAKGGRRVVITLDAGHRLFLSNTQFERLGEDDFLFA